METTKKFKIGDKVIVKNCSKNLNEKKGIVTNINFHRVLPYGVTLENKNYETDFREAELQLL